MSQTVVLYFGSFNPIHRGHVTVADAALDAIGADALWFVVSPQNPFKSPEKAANAAERFAAAVEAVRRHPELRVRVDDIELSMPAPQYTIRTLDALREREPGNEFRLVIGADNLRDILRWKDSERLLREYGVVVFPRPGFNAAELRDKLLRDGPSGCRIELMDAPPVDISSTEIREWAAAGRDVSAYLM